VTRWDNEGLYADWIPLHTQWRRRNCQVRARFSLVDHTPIAEAESKEMENTRRGPTFGDFVTIRTELSALLQDYRVQSTRVPYILPCPPPPSFKCNVLYESLSVDSQNIPCATLKRRGSWVISVYLWPNPKKKHGVWWPYSGADYNLSLCPIQSRLQHIYYRLPYARVHFIPQSET
jgi:hypothetical protein